MGDWEDARMGKSPQVVVQIRDTGDSDPRELEMEKRRGWEVIWS